MKGTCEQIPFHFFLKFMMLSGGRGTVLGALLGSLILATIAKALPLIPFFDQPWLNTIKGVIILVVVVVNIVLQRTADKNALKGREM